MLNIRSTPLFSAWVKNVYSLCVEGVETRAQSYTGALLSPAFVANMGVKPSRFTQLMDSYPLIEYTAYFPHFNPLLSRLYTVSTVPTITEDREKIRKDS